MTQHETASSFQALEVAHRITELLVGPLRSIRKHDRNLADQLQRAATSVVVNLAEGNGTNAGNRTRHFRIALGSLYEVRAALRVANAWEYITKDAPLLNAIDHLCAMTYRLLRPK